MSRKAVAQLPRAKPSVPRAKAKTEKSALLESTHGEETFADSVADTAVSQTVSAILLRKRSFAEQGDQTIGQDGDTNAQQQGTCDVQAKRRNVEIKKQVAQSNMPKKQVAQSNVPKKQSEMVDAVQHADFEKEVQSAGEEGEGEDSEEELGFHESAPPEDLESEEELDKEVERENGPEDLLDPVQVAELTPSIDSAYAGDWTGAPEPGSDGFNDFAAAVMRDAGVGSAEALEKLNATSACPSLLPHQESVAFLLHPKSPISRLLVDHPTGSGKTREMITVLDNYFHDPRPKIPILPTAAICRVFYTELLRWPSKYRDYFACLQPSDAALASKVRDWRRKRDHIWNFSSLPEAKVRHLCESVKYVLEMNGAFYMGRLRRSVAEDFKKKFPGEHLPAAPLRALRYTSAGGRRSEERR